MKARELLNKISEVAASRWKQPAADTSSDTSTEIGDEMLGVMIKAGYRFVGINTRGLFMFDDGEHKVTVSRSGDIFGLKVAAGSKLVPVVIYYFKKPTIDGKWQVSSGGGSFWSTEENVIKLLQGSSDNRIAAW